MSPFKLLLNLMAIIIIVVIVMIPVTFLFKCLIGAALMLKDSLQ